MVAEWWDIARGLGSAVILIESDQAVDLLVRSSRHVVDLRIRYMPKCAIHHQDHAGQPD
jgi:hypothetical protein